MRDELSSPRRTFVVRLSHVALRSAAMANQGMYREGGAPVGGLPLPRARLMPLTIAIGVTAFLALVVPWLLFGVVGHGGAGAWRMFRNGGWPMYLILLSGVVTPILVAVLGAFVVRGKRMPAGVLFVCASIPFALALFGAWIGQKLVVGAISGESVDPEQKARILAEGIAESMSNDIFGGLVACGVAIVASMAAASAAASIDVALAARGAPTPPSRSGAIGASAAGCVWLVATLVVGVIRLKSAGVTVFLPVLPLLVLVPFAVVAARGASVVHGWHDRDEGSRIAGALLVAAVSALFGVLALQRGLEATFTSKALEAIAGESIDPSQRLRILAYAVDAARLAPVSYAVHTVLGAATFGLALAPAIGGGKHPATPSAIASVAIALLLLGGALALGHSRESIPRAFDAAAQSSTPAGVALPTIVETLSDKRSGSGYGRRLVVTKDGSGEGTSSTSTDRFSVFADKDATMAMVRARLPERTPTRITFVANRAHPPEIVARLGYLGAYLGRTDYVAATIEDEPLGVSTSDTFLVVSVADDAITIDGKRHPFPFPEGDANDTDSFERKHNVRYVFRKTDSVERAVRIVASVEQRIAQRIYTWDLERTFVVDDEARRRPPLQGAGQDGFGGFVGQGGLGVVRAPTLRGQNATVTGRLPPEVIQRIVRQNFGRFRLCYENGLRTNAKLAGRVSVKFVIDRSGAVATAVDAGSTLPDTAVVACVVRSFGNLTFPQPEGGIVTVVYPIDFSPGS